MKNFNRKLNHWNDEKHMWHFFCLVFINFYDCKIEIKSKFKLLKYSENIAVWQLIPVGNLSLKMLKLVNWKPDNMQANFCWIYGSLIVGENLEVSFRVRMEVILKDLKKNVEHKTWPITTQIFGDSNPNLNFQLLSSAESNRYLNTNLYIYETVQRKNLIFDHLSNIRHEKLATLQNPRPQKVWKSFINAPMMV